MMKPLKTFLMTMLLGLTAASAAKAQSCAASAADQAKDQAAILDTMHSFFSAAANDDMAKFHSVVTANFYAFDGGKRFDGDALMELIKSAHAAGKVYVWSITEPEIHVECNTAWIAYVDHGSIQEASGKKDLTWLESGIFERQNGSWRIRFLHSTRVPQP
jgi:hypothetical protein